MSVIFQGVTDHLSCNPEVKTMPVACRYWNVRYQAVTHSRLSWLAEVPLMERIIATPLSYLLRRFFSLVVFLVGERGGMPVRQLGLTVPCAGARMGDARHFKSLRDAWHLRTWQAGPGGSRGQLTVPESPTPSGLSGTGGLKKTLCLGHCQ